MSFAIFQHASLDKLMTADFTREIGFDAGDRALAGIYQLRLGSGGTVNGSLFYVPTSEQNSDGLVFRIDGMYVCDICMSNLAQFDSKEHAGKTFSCHFLRICIGHVVIEAFSDTCGARSVPLRSVQNNVTCVCREGVRSEENARCVGEEISYVALGIANELWSICT